jgi:chromosome segregation ATPase
MNSKIQSSMKYENLSGLNEDEIIDKYEHLLTEREKQIRDLSYKFGKLNSQLIDNEEKINTINSELIDLDKNYNKTIKNLKMEVENIQILKKQIEQYEKENMELREKVKIKLSNFDGKEQKGNNIEKNKEKLTPTQKLLSENIDYIPVFNK